MNERLILQEQTSHHNLARIGRRAGVLALASASLYGLTACGPPPEAKGPCTHLTAAELKTIDGYPWHSNQSSPLKGAYIMFSSADVQAWSNGKEGSMNNFPQSYELKVFTNPADKNNDDITSAVQGIYRYADGINTTDRILTSLVPHGAVDIEFFKGECGLDIVGE